jgi:hypothetical protein
MKNLKSLSSKILFAGFFCIVIITLSGCKKCRECTARNSVGSLVATEEKCGTNAALNTFEEEFSIKYLLYEVQCQDK